MGNAHDGKHVSVLTNFVLNDDLDSVLELECDKCMSFVDYVTTVDRFGNVKRKTKEEIG